MVFKDLCILVRWAKVASALEGLTLMLLVANLTYTCSVWPNPCAAVG